MDEQEEFERYLEHLSAGLGHADRRLGLSTPPEELPLEHMVLQAKMRWRIERDYQDLKQEVGFGHYEGRSWRVFRLVH